MPRASRSQPAVTATYCCPSTANELGTPSVPVGIGKLHNCFPLPASNALNNRSIVPPAKRMSPPVTNSGAQRCDLKLEGWGQLLLSPPLTKFMRGKRLEPRVSELLQITAANHPT